MLCYVCHIDLLYIRIMRDLPRVSHQSVVHNDDTHLCSLDWWSCTDRTHMIEPCNVNRPEDLFEKSGGACSACMVAWLFT